MSTSHTPGPWVRYDSLTNTYNTPDGTKVPAELCDAVQCLADVLRIAQVRNIQRAAISKAKGQS